MVVIVNYGSGNIGSVANIIKKAGATALVSSDAADIERATRLILPGIGAFDTCMGNLNASGLIPALRERVLNAGIPLLGICVGMQMLMGGSEEGVLPGLGWIAGHTKRFAHPAEAPMRVPHMVWNDIVVKRVVPLFAGLENEARFYFVHSYHVQCERSQDILGETVYGYPFTSAVQSNNIAGVQFHPEKSHKFGLALIRNFVAAS